jgi:exopolysaccharide biosynthesis polyprenyl glycosylphosphotransferase
MNPKTEYQNSFVRSLDFACVVCAFAVASDIAALLSTVGRFTWPDAPTGALAGWPPEYVVLLVSSLVSWSVVSTYFGIHTSQHHIESRNYTYWRLARTLVVWAGITEASLFLLKLQGVSRQFTLSFAAIASALIILREFLQMQYSTAAGSEGRKAVILGVDRETQWLATALSAKPEWSNRIKTADLKCLPDLAAKCMSNQLEPGVEFFILPAGQDMPTVERCTLELLKQKRAVHIVPAIMDTTLFRHSLGDLDGVPLITLEPGRLSGLEARLKRALDAGVAVALLFLLAPLMALLAAFVKLTSAGPMVFSQERLGQDGQRFRIYKFRTMRKDAEALLRNSPELYAKYSENNFKLPDGDDFRITRIGRFLRATSLDELPQLLNVLKGDMSLVGPRPIVPAEIEKYGEYGPLLLSVKPGMTGQWQVNGRANVVDYAHRVKLDMEYIRDQSLRGDVQILVKTISAVARMEGAR